MDSCCRTLFFILYFNCDKDYFALYLCLLFKFCLEQPNDYKIDEKSFDHGGCGEVFMCTRLSDNKRLVVKKAKLEDVPAELRDSEMQVQIKLSVILMIIKIIFSIF